MNRIRSGIFAWVVVALVALWSEGQCAETEPTEGGIRFAVAHVFVDAGRHHLAAYQVSVRALRGEIKIVGIEGGADPAFKDAPHYDPRAMQQDQVVLAAFSLNPLDALPSGMVRVATVHYQVSGSGDAVFEIKLHAAADASGAEIQPKVSITKGTP